MLITVGFGCLWGRGETAQRKKFQGDEGAESEGKGLDRDTTAYEEKMEGIAAWGYSQIAGD